MDAKLQQAETGLLPNVSVREIPPARRRDADLEDVKKCYAYQEYARSRELGDPTTEGIEPPCPHDESMDDATWTLQVQAWIEQLRQWTRKYRTLIPNPMEDLPRSPESSSNAIEMRSTGSAEDAPASRERASEPVQPCPECSRQAQATSSIYFRSIFPTARSPCGDNFEWKEDTEMQEPHHRLLPPPRPVLKSKNGPLAEQAEPQSLRWLDTPGPGATPVAQKVSIESFKGQRQALWWLLPGTTVECDRCNRRFPSAQGELQGLSGSGRSPGASDTWICKECQKKEVLDAFSVKLAEFFDSQADYGEWCEDVADPDNKDPIPANKFAQLLALANGDYEKAREMHANNTVQTMDFGQILPEKFTIDEEWDFHPESDRREREASLHMFTQICVIAAGGCMEHARWIVNELWRRSDQRGITHERLEDYLLVARAFSRNVYRDKWLVKWHRESVRRLSIFYTEFRRIEAKELADQEMEVVEIATQDWADACVRKGQSFLFEVAKPNFEDMKAAEECFKLALCIYKSSSGKQDQMYKVIVALLDQLYNRMLTQKDISHQDYLKYLVKLVKLHYKAHDDKASAKYSKRLEKVLTATWYIVQRGKALLRRQGAVEPKKKEAKDPTELKADKKVRKKRLLDYIASPQRAWRPETKQPRTLEPVSSLPSPKDRSKLLEDAVSLEEPDTSQAMEETPAASEADKVKPWSSSDAEMAPSPSEGVGFFGEEPGELHLRTQRWLLTDVIGPAPFVSPVQCLKVVPRQVLALPVYKVVFAIRWTEQDVFYTREPCEWFSGSGVELPCPVQ